MAMALAFASYLLGEREEDAEDDSPQTRRATSMLRKWEHPDLHFTYPTIKLASMGDHSPVSLDFVKEWRERGFLSANQRLDKPNGQDKQRERRQQASHHHGGRERSHQPQHKLDVEPRRL